MKQPDKQLKAIFDAVNQLPRHYKVSIVACDSDKEDDVYLAYSCCRSCAIRAMEIGQACLEAEIEDEHQPPVMMH